MNALKRVVVDGRRLGPHTLQSSITGRRCCLGFACLAMGIYEGDLIDMALPSSVSEYMRRCLDENWNPWMKPIPQYIKEKAASLMPWKAEHFGSNLEDIASTLNDSMWVCNTMEIREQIISLLRLIFKEAGFIFVLTHKSEIDWTYVED